MENGFCRCPVRVIGYQLLPPRLARSPSRRVPRTRPRGDTEAPRPEEPQAVVGRRGLPRHLLA